MKIKDIISSGKISMSFEVFPPKTDSVKESIKSATEEIAKLKPSFISVTYGAGGGTSEYTLDIAKNIQSRFNVPALAHLTCVSSSKETVKKRIEDIKNAGIENIMALRGDVPESMKNDDRSNWDYHYAVELIEEIKSTGYGFCVGGACYPEIHPESPNQTEEIKHLKEKVQAGCDFLTTQMFFDNALLYNFLFKIRDAGINVPVIAGIMPIVNAKQVERAIKLSGSLVPQRFKSIVDKFGSDPAAMKQAGIAYATDQIIDLYANGINNVHVYTMNNPSVALAIKNNVSDILGK